MDRHRVYYEKNKEEIKKKARKKYQENKEEYKKQRLKYYHENKIAANKRQQARKERRKIFIEEIKLNGGCVDCGYREFAAALEFHHINSDDKKFNLAKYPDYNKKVLAKEICKCVILCSNCHKVITKYQQVYRGQKLRNQ